MFDLDGNGEIQMKEFISSLDRLEWSVPYKSSVITLVSIQILIIRKHGPVHTDFEFEAIRAYHNFTLLTINMIVEFDFLYLNICKNDSKV